MKKIMVVDDEQDILFSLKNLLEDYCYEVVTVDSGKKCIQELQKGFCGLVLMDIMMPTMDGWDTIEEIVHKGLDKNIVITIITGKGTQNHEKFIKFESYIKDYLVKPLDVQTIIESIERCYHSLSNR
jgi:CheY-like chemotaxis protein